MTAQKLDAKNWTFLYNQIINGEIGYHALFVGTPQANPSIANGGIFKANSTESYNYTNLTFSVDNNKLTTDNIILANFNAIDDTQNNYLLGYMGKNQAGSASFLISNFILTNTEYHTLLFNTNFPYDTTALIQISFYNSGAPVSSINFSLNITDSPDAGQNYIVNLPKSNLWNEILISVPTSTSYSTNIVGILRTTFQLTPDNLVCFAENSMVLTPNGEIAIQNLKQGDIIYDKNYNHQNVEFIAKRTVFPCKSINKHSIPIEIKQGHLGNNVPNRDTIVSSAHLIMHKDEMVAAYKLGQSVEIESVITYYNVSVSNYSTMIVNGLVSETLDTSNDQKVYEKMI